MNADSENGFHQFVYETMPYRFFIPENLEKEKKYPLLVHFHGAGSRGNDNLKQIAWVKLFAEKGMQKNNPCFIVAPQCPAEKRWVDTDWHLPKHEMPAITHEMMMAVEIISGVIAENPVDTERIYLTGQSMGGFAVWDILCRKPELFAAAVPVCGGADETKAGLIKDIPVWAFHGAKDKTVDVTRSRNIIEALRKAEGNPRYTEYEDVAHNAWEFAYSENGLSEWLFQQKK
ncbi:MAG: hypothetical protein A2017_10835 [Lentisphaerae bacterium GWF2_44_16]|nr:MAG: hypothetical protein A2017_10835 [Lentisphaerae bacterium GWF2_44_16]